MTYIIKQIFKWSNNYKTITIKSSNMQMTAYINAKQYKILKYAIDCIYKCKTL